MLRATSSTPFRVLGLSARCFNCRTLLRLSPSYCSRLFALPALRHYLSTLLLPTYQNTGASSCFLPVCILHVHLPGGDSVQWSRLSLCVPPLVSIVASSGNWPFQTGLAATALLLASSGCSGHSCSLVIVSNCTAHHRSPVEPSIGTY